MSVTAEKRKRKRVVSPDETGITTPVGIAANDPDAYEDQELYAGWTQVRPRLRNLIHLPKGKVAPADHRRAVDLEQRAVVSPQELAEGECLVAKYFPADSARSATSAAQEGGAADHAEDADRKSPAGFRTLSRVSLDLLVRHPDNRHPTAEAIAARARSIEQHGLEHPPTVRRLPPGHAHIPKGFQGAVCWQILSGETRVLALRKLGRKGEIDAEVKPCGDAEALDYLARDNAERTDLDPIEKARLMKRLCQSVAEGGGGKTTQQVAQLYGLKDGSSVSNLVRLLELPKVWQERVKSGELPQSFARLLLPYAHAPKVMDAIDARWAKDHGPKARDWERERWETRDEFERQVDVIAEDMLRPIDGRTKHRFDYNTPGLDQLDWSQREQPRLFELTEDVRKQLEIHTFEIDGKQVEMATHHKLWDKLQIPLVKQKAAKQTKAAAAKGGREDKPAPQKLTPAQQKAREKEKAEQLQRRIDEWRHRWIASLLVELLPEEPMVGEWITVAVAAGGVHLPTPNYMAGTDPRDGIVTAIGGSKRFEVWGIVAKASRRPLGDFDEVIEKAKSALAACVLASCASAGYSPLDDEQLDDLAAYCKLDLSHKWADLQRLADSLVSKKNADRARYEAFFQLHQNAQLDALGDELGVKVDHVSGKEQKIKLLLGCQRQLKLPKSIRPLEKAKRGKKK